MLAYNHTSLLKLPLLAQAQLSLALLEVYQRFEMSSLPPPPTSISSQDLHVIDWFEKMKRPNYLASYLKQ